MISTRTANGVLVKYEIDGVSQLGISHNWPLWARTLKKLATPEDKGIGDVVARTIGPEKSDAFKSWFLVTFGRPCNCNGRQERWNKLYPLNE